MKSHHALEMERALWAFIEIAQSFPDEAKYIDPRLWDHVCAYRFQGESSPPSDKTPEPA